jgi:hypothetical protein
MLVHAPEHIVWPEPQTRVHEPAEQTCPDWHAMAQPPQLFGSLPVLTHVPLQDVYPELQTVPLQTPLTHAWPLPQAAPQEPQFDASFW